MKVLEYLKNNSLEDLKEEFGIKVKEYSEYNLAVLNYSQTDSPKFHPIVMECRGLIIDTEYLVPVSKTFSRFFNLNENSNEVFAFDQPFRVEEKADGSLMSVYYFDGSWRIASRGTAFGEGSCDNTTFHDLFEDIIGMDINNFMNFHNKDLYYTFEMCSLSNKVVKMYKKSCVYLLNIQDMYGKEFSAHLIDFVAGELGVLRPKVYEFKNVKEAVKSFENFEPTDEGYVLIDFYGKRLKIKNPAYVDLHQLKGNDVLTAKRITDIIFRGETEEILSYFPELKEYFDPWVNAYEQLLKDIENWHYIMNVPGKTQKEFALSIRDFGFKSILFMMRRGLTIEESFQKITANGKAKLLENYVIKRR